MTVVASIIDSSDVYGATGGFNVLATNGDGNTGKAGGYAGELLGVQIQNSNSYNFAHIIGRESAGGYVGTMEPGSAADVVDGLSTLGGLISADNLLGVLQAFVPVIKNSETTCVPCGGAVRLRLRVMTVFTVDLQEDMRVTTMAVRSGETIRITGKVLHIQEP